MGPIVSSVDILPKICYPVSTQYGVRYMNSKRLLQRFLRYISCDSESKNERQFCEMMEAELKAVGFETARDEIGGKIGSNGFNLYGWLPGEGTPILFSCHMDTVTPGVNIQPVVVDGVVRSGGDTILGADDKSGIAAVLEAVESIREQKKAHRPVEVLFSVCEELGLLGAKHADYSRIKSKQAIVLDGGLINSVDNQSPANMHLYFAITGKSAHAAAEPEKGIHALKAAVQAIANIPCGYVDDLSVMNVANLLAPGKTNVVPDKATFDMEIRSFSEERLNEHARNAEEAVKAACEAYGAQYTLTSEKLFGILHVPAESPLAKRLAAVYRELGIELKLERTYGGCDATWLFSHGIDALNIGTGMQDPHGLSEHIAISDLELTTKAVELMMLPE